MTPSTPAAASQARPEQVLYETDHVRITRRQQPDGTPVVVKHALSLQAIRRLEHEAGMLKRLAHVPGLAHIAGEPPEPHTLVLHDAGAVALGDHLRTHPLNLAQVLDYVRAVARILAQVHQAGVVHKDIGPANLLIHPETLAPTLIDFNIAGNIGDGEDAGEAQSGIAGTLAYLSPEQTGRTGRNPDQRSDLYSLGITLYEVLTGRRPFEGTDLLELVHAHLVQVPEPPKSLKPELPQIVSDLVMRLLEKEPDRRYQSADGLAQDLERIAADPRPFPLGQFDFGTRLKPPAKLIGREAPLDAMRAAIATASQGGSACLLVTGAAGAGKSALLAALRPLASLKHGWVVLSKFEAARRDAPGAMFDGFQALGRQLLAEPAERLAHYRQRILGAMGRNLGTALTQLPEFQMLLGPHDALDLPDAQEAEARSIEAALTLLRAVASPDRPLVLVYDDVQWAPRGSGRILDAVVTSEQPFPGLVIVCAYSEEELDETHALRQLVPQWQAQGRVPVLLPLPGLAPEVASAFIGEMLRLPEPEATRLAQALAPRTLNNPQEIIALLNALRHDGLLTQAQGAWHWNADAVRRHVGDANPADLARRLRALPVGTTALLQALACLGTEVTPEVLGWAAELDAPALAEHAAPALDDGVLLASAGDPATLRLANAPVQQAVLGAMSPAARGALHLAIARRLAGHRAASDGLDARVAQQYLLAGGPWHDEAEARLAVDLFEQAATRLRLTDSVQAERYLAAAVQAFAPVAGADDAQRLFTLQREHHRALFEQGRLEQADGLYESLASAAGDPTELLDSTRIQIYGLMNRRRGKDGMALGLGLLAKLGLPKPADPRPAIAEGIKRLTIWYRGEGKLKDFEAPEISDPQVVSWTKMLPETSNTAYTADLGTWAWCILEGTRLWIEHGPSPRMLSAFAGAPMILLGAPQDYRGAYQVAQHAIAVGDARGYQPATSFVRCIFGMAAAHWVDPIEDTVETVLRRARRDLNRIGDESFVSNTYLACDLLFDCATTLDTAASELEEGLAFAARSKNKEFELRYTPRRQLIRALRGQTRGPGSLDDDDFESARHEQSLDPDSATLAAYESMRTLVAGLFGDQPALLDHSTKAVALRVRMPGYYLSMAGRVLHAVALNEHLRTLPAEQRAPVLAELDACVQWVSARAADAPHNFLHLQRWVEAERAWATESVWQAGIAFDAAVAEALKHERPWHRAMIHERAALFHLSQGMEHSALPLMLYACEAYDAWGASAKVKQLRRTHPFLRAALQKRSENASASTMVDTEAVDMIAVLRASQALSSETSLARLTVQVGKVLGAITGATGVRLIVKADDGSGAWMLADSLGAGGTPVTVEQAGAEAQLPLSVFRYVERLNQVLVVDDVTSDDRFAEDPYAQRFSQCSLMLVPILKQGALNAMLVLENEQRRKAFSAERLDSVAMIAGQLAVSLDNALLYASLEKRVAERTAQLRQKTNDINAMLQNMPQGVLTVVSGGTIHPEYSAYLETILETQEIAMQPLMALLFEGSNLGADALSQVDAVLSSVIGEDEMNYGFNSHLLATEFDKTLPDGRVKSLALSWSPICDDGGVVDKLMLCVRDVTELKRLEAEAGARKRELQLIGEILAVSQEKFHEFIDGAQAFLEENRRLIAQAEGKQLETVQLLFRNMHTIKGNARTYGLLGLTNLVHVAEQRYDDLRKSDETPWDSEALLAELAEVKAAVDQYAHVNDSVLGRKGPGRRGSVEKFLMVEKETVQQAMQVLQRADRADLASVNAALDAVNARLNLLGTAPLAEVIDGAVASLPSLAQELGKAAPEVHIEDHGIVLRTQAAGLMKNLFTHLLRNSVDHGLETPEQRAAAGKPEAGRIDLRLQVDDGKLLIHLHDDGRGLAIGKIRERAMAQNLVTRGTSDSAEEVAQLIFRSGFSTAEQVTEVSGRGVGMDAVRSFLEKEGGSIAIRFLDDNEEAEYRPFETVIALPDKFAASAQAVATFEALLGLMPRANTGA
ncbi:MAG: AAA family ATPase [Burkholderiales bacterium]|nr:AAA family ATPase [Burkholderiales bacterium]